MQKNSGQGIGGDLLFLAQKDGFMKAILKMSNQEFGYVPASMERIVRPVALGSRASFPVFFFMDEVIDRNRPCQ